MSDKNFHRNEFEKEMIKRFKLRSRYRGMENLDKGEGGRYILTDFNRYWDVWCAALSFCENNPIAIDVE